MVDLILNQLDLLNPFPSLDKELVELALVENGDNTELINKLERRYNLRLGSSDNKSLVFYGRALLDMLVVDRISLAYGLNIDSDNMTQLRQTMTSDDRLMEFSRQLNICSDAFNDKFIAVIGVLYIQYGMPSFYQIKDWFFSLKPIASFFEEKMVDLYTQRQQVIRDRGYIPSLKWTVNDNVDNFLKQYLAGGTTATANTAAGKHLQLLEEVLDKSHNLYMYYIYNPSHDREFYLDSLVKGDKPGLKQALIGRGIWIPT